MLVAVGRRAVWLLVALGVLMTGLPLLMHRAGLRAGDTVLLPGRLEAGAWVVQGRGEVSWAMDVRNGGVLPVRVDGPADPAQQLGRGPAGGGLPEEAFAPFTLWPGQSRLVVVHAGGQAATYDAVELAGSVLGVARALRVALPQPVRVLPEPS